MVLPEGLVRSLRNAAASMGLKAPWQVTGSWTSPDYQHYLVPGTEYRKVSPGSQPPIARVPHDPPQLVYDIKYYVRDDRRNSKWTARTVDKTPFDFNKMFAAAPLRPEEVKLVPPAPTMPTRGY